MAVAIIGLTMSSVYADIEEDLYLQLDKLDIQYSAILEEFEFVEPDLSDAQYEQMESRFAPLDEKSESLYADFENGLITEEILESKSLELETAYDTIYEEFGFVEPELTEEQSELFNQKIDALEEQYVIIEDQLSHSECE